MDPKNRIRIRFQRDIISEYLVSDRIRIGPHRKPASDPSSFIRIRNSVVNALLRISTTFFLSIHIWNKCLPQFQIIVFSFKYNFLKMYIFWKEEKSSYHILRKFNHQCNRNVEGKRTNETFKTLPINITFLSCSLPLWKKQGWLHN